MVVSEPDDNKQRQRSGNACVVGDVARVRTRGVRYARTRHLRTTDSASAAKHPRCARRVPGPIDRFINRRGRRPVV